MHGGMGMNERRHRIISFVVSLIVVLTTYFVMATVINRSDVVAIAGTDQTVDVNEEV